MSATFRQIMVQGRVQGVGFRFWVEQQAKARGLEGWVRNCRDGSVEALFVGPADVVAGMVAACRQGPSSAQVKALQEEPGHPDGLRLRHAGERFSVLPTI